MPHLPIGGTSPMHRGHQPDKPRPEPAKLPSDVLTFHNMMTFTGRYINPRQLSVDDIDIRDIAHGLSNCCRFAGQCSRFYCPVETELILTANLNWIAAGNLKEGEKLVGFDEYPPSPYEKRCLRETEVVHSRRLKTRVIRLEMEDGSTAATSQEHPWLIATKRSNNHEWHTASEIKRAVEEGRNRYMYRYFDTWKQDFSYGSGWLAGIADGEGCLSSFKNSFFLQISQREGVVLDAICKRMSNCGFEFSIHSAGDRDCKAVQLIGGFKETVRFLGLIRPIRLLENYRKYWKKVADNLRGKTLFGYNKLRIVKAYDEGIQWVCGLETGTHTYFCNGFGAHNSVAEHSVHVSNQLRGELAKEGLLHDAPEAYLGDLVKCVKFDLHDYKALEQEVWDMITRKFGIRGWWDKPPETRHSSGLSEEVYEADMRVLVTERHALISDKSKVWDVERRWKPYPDLKIQGWRPQWAEVTFLQRYAELFPESVL